MIHTIPPSKSKSTISAILVPRCRFLCPWAKPGPFPAVNYDKFDKTQALLIAVDFSDRAVSLSQIGMARPQPGAVAYFFLGAHAGETDRTRVARPVLGDGQYADTVCLIEKIEVK